MFVVTEAEAAAIRAAFEQRGELSAAVELRRLFPAVTDTAQARACARTIAGWKPLAVPLRLGKRREFRAGIGSASLMWRSRRTTVSSSTGRWSATMTVNPRRFSIN